ncbi:hypothetical protein QSH18_01500 [Xanthomonas sp. NCPPB 2654]|uniref:hypothetical protein n=1 Tax=unclassified Xanthomonas TaxID=2643310 RepID=UPI0021E014DB|nr:MULTISPECIES: hypothetical protein [unclassified Xanthomonas]MDL5364272.1 hypothetical protein [Xanthomonas sp. NCPPB 2654]UYC20430.1 hypothetical protein NUG20_20155 [Xanthomonas sp. CFBP 8443]
MRRALVLLWLLYSATAMVAPADASEEPALPAVTALYQQGQADGVQLAQSLYCDLPQDGIVRLVDALQRAARERALAAGVDFDAARHEAAMQTGFDDFSQLMANLDARGDAQDLAQRQAHYLAQCAEVRVEIEALIGPLPKQAAKD